MKPISFFIPTSNLIIEKSQITLDLVAKDVEKVVFQKMRKSFQFGKLNKLVFILGVTHEVRIYENLKNVFKEAMREQFSQAKHHEKPDIVENLLQIPLNLSSKNVKNAFFESMTSYQNESGTTSLTFTFTLLSTDPIYAELEDNFSKESKESEKNTPPPIPWETHPSRRAVSNPPYRLAPQLTRGKSLLEKTIEFFNKRFSRNFFPIPQARYTLHAFDSDFECGTESCEDFKRPLNSFRDDDPIYKERKPSEDFGYATIPFSRGSIKSFFSNTGYEVPRQVEPAIYLEVLS